MTQNDFDEMVHLREFAKECNCIVYNTFSKVTGHNMPDYLGIRPDKSHLYVELTQILPADKIIMTGNFAIERFRINLYDALKVKLTGRNIYNLNVDILQNSLPKIDDRTSVINELTMLVSENLKIGRTDFHKGNLSQQLQFIDQLSIIHISSRKPCRQVLVRMNTLFSDPDNLKMRIIKSIKKKSEKKYYEHVGPIPVWLVITIRDGINSINNIKNLNLYYEDSSFERIYLQSDYWVPGNNYPIVRVF